jgi:hypothetical protein
VIQDEFRIIVKPFERWNFICTADYYVPDLSNKNTDFLFIDSSLEYVAKKKQMACKFQNDKHCQRKKL